jgi:pimeloyl-ACP methyl ester carboxylesterase
MYVRGVWVNVWRGGKKGVPLLLLPGWGGYFPQYDHLLTALVEENFEVYAVEFPGYGKSDSPGREWTFDTYMVFLEELFCSLNLPRAIVLGHSLGSPFALRFASTFPERVEKLVIVNAPIFSKKNWVFLGLFDIVFTVGVILLKPAAVVARLCQHALRRYRLQSWLEWFYRQHYFLTHSRGVMRKILREIVYGTDTREDARRVKAETLIIWGERAWLGLTPLRNAHALRENIAKHDFAVIPRAGHHPHHGWSKELAGIVSCWVSEKTKTTEQPL